jgi:hypothetical protein
MEFRIEELRQMLLYIEEQLERQGRIVDDRLLTRRNNIRLMIKQLEQANKEQQMNNSAKWFHFSQNNSGGFFITNEAVAEDVYIQAESADHAADRAVGIFADYSEFCECCGERWSTTPWDDGYDVPTKYDIAVSDYPADHWHKQARLHHLDGNIETVFYKLTKEQQA